MKNIINHQPIVGVMRWGVWGSQFTTEQYEEIIYQCLSIGLNEFDHADIYGHYTTEAEFGKALQNNSSLRTQIKIITKCGIQMITPNRPDHQIKSYNTSAAHITASVEQSLRNFHTDYLDTILIHRPDVLMNPVEIAETITQLKAAGKIKSFGVSNFTPSQLSLINKHIKVDYHQVEISVTNLDAFTNGVLDQCQNNSIKAQAWSPWGNGLFTEKTERHQRILDCAEALSKKYSTGVNEILLAFLYTHPAKITPVIGTTQFARIKQAKEAMHLQLSTEDFYKLYSASVGAEVA
jgi:predicted oxidoreductase